jgi:hypothetical protein
MSQGRIDLAGEQLPAPTAELQLHRSLQCLSMCHIRAIDGALAAIGDYGEVRLVKNGGKLRFIQTLRSESLTSGE